MTHLLLAVTAHGYGHLAQCAPVVDSLSRRIPGLRVTLQGDIDPAFARRRLGAGFNQIPESADVGLLMDGPLVTRWAESLVLYGAFEADYEARLERQLGLLRELAPDLVLADVPWLPLDAAHRLGIPGIALSSLSWYDILRESPLGAQVPAALLGHLRSIYGRAELFIRPAPSMPMGWLPNGVDVGPIALRQPDRRAEVRARLGLPPDRSLAMLQFGGSGGLDPLRDWPEQDQVHWLVQDLLGRRRRDASDPADLGLNLQDLLGSLDFMVTKPGYGSFAEAACNGVPVLYLSRPDWPEEPALTRWMHAHARAREIPLSDLLAGDVAAAIWELLAAPRPEPVEPSGIEQAADLIEPLLRRSRG